MLTTVSRFCVPFGDLVPMERNRSSAVGNGDGPKNTCEANKVGQTIAREMDAVDAPGQQVDAFFELIVNVCHQCLLPFTLFLCVLFKSLRFLDTALVSMKSGD